MSCRSYSIMIKQNRPLMISWSIAFLLLISAQCVSTSGEAIPVDATPVTLTYLTWTNDSDIWGAAENDAIAEFESTRPRVTVSRKRYGNSTRDHLNEATPPDVMLVWPYDDTLALAEEGVLLDVTELWESLDFEEGYPPHYIDMTTVDGKKYHIPVAYSWAAIYYNKAVFNRLGLRPPETWDEFLFVSDTLWNSGITPIALAGDNPWVATLWFDYLNLRLNGPEFHARLIQGQERYDDPKVRKVLEFWQLLQTREYFSSEAWSKDSLQAISDVIQGDDELIRPREPAAMILASADWLGYLTPKFQAELGFFRFPIIDPAVPVGEVVISVGYMIPANAANPAEALDFLAYAGSSEGQSRFGQQLGLLNTYFPAKADVDAQLLPPAIQQGQALVQTADAMGTAYFQSIPGPMRGQVSGMLRRFLQGSTDIDGLLGDLEKDRQRIYTQP